MGLRLSEEVAALLWQRNNLVVSSALICVKNQEQLKLDDWPASGSSCLLLTYLECRWQMEEGQIVPWLCKWT